ncbi:MAG: RT0821/Lpp0805 family surface protein [Bradyrhizobium sp.]
MILVGFMVSGCSLLPRSDGPYAMASDDDVTGTIATRADARGPAASDLAFARDAASDVLTRGGKGASQPWQNPKTGAHGSVTPLDAAYTEDGHTCRDILASYVNGATQSWLQGAACKSAGGTWEIHTLKPWRQG